jgi:hypothetical protein
LAGLEGEDWMAIAEWERMKSVGRKKWERRKVVNRD